MFSLWASFSGRIRTRHELRPWNVTGRSFSKTRLPSQRRRPTSGCLPPKNSNIFPPKLIFRRKPRTSASATWAGQLSRRSPRPCSASGGHRWDKAFPFSPFHFTLYNNNNNCSRNSTTHCSKNFPSPTFSAKSVCLNTQILHRSNTQTSWPAASMTIINTNINFKSLRPWRSKSSNSSQIRITKPTGVPQLSQHRRRSKMPETLSGCLGCCFQRSRKISRWWWSSRNLSSLKSHFSARNARRDFQLNLVTSSIRSCTEPTKFKRRSPASSATRATRRCRRWRCTRARTPCPASARSAARASPDPGCFRAMFEPTLARNRFHAGSAPGASPTSRTCELTFRPTCRQRSTLANIARRPSAGWACSASTPRLAARSKSKPNRAFRPVSCAPKRTYSILKVLSFTLQLIGITFHDAISNQFDIYIMYKSFFKCMQQ